MILDLKDRLMLANQMRIMEALYPDDARHYATHRKALESGFSLNYEWLLRDFSDEMSVGECKEVWDILEMYRAITFSIERHGADPYAIPGSKFPGFDGNLESQLLAYVTYILVDLERYEELRGNSILPRYDSHSPMILKYRAMLDRWRMANSESLLSLEQIRHILGN